MVRFWITLTSCVCNHKRAATQCQTIWKNKSEYEMVKHIWHCSNLLLFYELILPFSHWLSLSLALRLPLLLSQKLLQGAHKNTNNIFYDNVIVSQDFFLSLSAVELLCCPFRFAIDIEYILYILMLRFCINVSDQKFSIFTRIVNHLTYTDNWIVCHFGAPIFGTQFFCSVFPYDEELLEFK